MKKDSTVYPPLKMDEFGVAVRAWQRLLCVCVCVCVCVFVCASCSPHTTLQEEAAPARQPRGMLSSITLFRIKHFPDEKC